MTAGLVLQLIVKALVPPQQALVAQVLGFIAGALLVGGGAKTSVAKGFSPWFGLLGLFSFVGMGLILLFPDRDRFRPVDYPRRARDAGET